jgi:hypothetical protein
MFSLATTEKKHTVRQVKVSLGVVLEHLDRARPALQIQLNIAICLPFDFFINS